MSTYSGRHGPNVSQYLRDLNTLSPQDAAADESFGMDDDLALFTNTQFFDFDSGQNMDFQAQPVKMDDAATQHGSSPSDDATSAPSVMGDMPNIDFIAGDFNFTDFNNAYSAPSLNSFADGSQSFQPLRPNHAPAQVPQPQSQFQQGSARAADKRKADTMAGAGSQQLNFEEASRMAAEEDKRRRNTAASARFRIKKKQREQALEKSAKEMTEKISTLESKVSQLETENKWLKNLLVEKNEGGDDITSMWKEFTKHASEKAKAASGEPSSSVAIKAER